MREIIFTQVFLFQPNCGFR